MKNLKGKTRPVSNPYAKYEANGWCWSVLKHYQSPDKERDNPYSRVFCLVTSPIVPRGELGDVYCHEIPGFKFEDEEGDHAPTI
jgi:hypothetical protein